MNSYGLTFLPLTSSAYPLKPLGENAVFAKFDHQIPNFLLYFQYTDKVYDGLAIRSTFDYRYKIQQVCVQHLPLCQLHSRVLAPLLRQTEAMLWRLRLPISRSPSGIWRVTSTLLEALPVSWAQLNSIL